MDQNNIRDIFPISFKKFSIVIILSFVIPIICIIMIVSFVTSGSKIGAGSDILSNESISARIAPVARFDLQDSFTPKVFKTGEQIFSNVCATCHLSGIAGAPRLGDNSSWASIIQAGYNAALKIAIEGKGAMPPRGGNSSLTDYEIARAVVYMVNNSGGFFEEPEKPQ